MFKTFERTERTPTDITGQGTESPDEKRTKNGYERTRTDKTIFLSVTRPIARCDRNFKDSVKPESTMLHFQGVPFRLFQLSHLGNLEAGFSRGEAHSICILALFHSSC